MSSNVGGTAASGGFDFQHRVAAWIAVRILAEKDATEIWGLNDSFTFIRCETEQPVDDILIGIGRKGFAFLQTKRTLNLSDDPKSEFASAVSQFCRQFLVCRDARTSPRDWERPLDPAADRLVLVVGPEASGRIRFGLRQVLNRIRGLESNQPVSQGALNQDETEALTFTLNHLRRVWREQSNSNPSAADERQLLTLIWIDTLDVQEGGSDERNAKDLLLSSILSSEESDEAWALMLEACAGFAANRSGGDRLALQQLLLRASVSIKANRSYRGDIERLRNYSVRTAELLADYSYIRLGSSQVRIHREATIKLLALSEEGSLLVIGEPGSGKSGVLYELAKNRLEANRDLLFFAADHISSTSLDQLSTELGLDRFLVDVLENWPDTRVGFLVIDAMDAARADRAARVLRELIFFVIRRCPRWKVVASIRKFDLRWSSQLADLFRGGAGSSPDAPFQDQEFIDVRHLNVPKLSPSELVQVCEQSTELKALIARASENPTGLKELLTSPFNLRLAAELLEQGVKLDELTPIHTTFELLNLYWHHRVIRNDLQRDAREMLLREICNAMVSARMLRVHRGRIATAATGPILHDLLSSGLLTEDAATDTIRFSHHVLFDYAVERVWLKDSERTIANQLSADPDLLLVIRPSLVFYFERLWKASEPSRQSFWREIIQLLKTSGIPEVAKLIGPSSATELASSIQDFEPLFGLLSGPDAVPSSAAIRHIVGALLARGPECLSGPTAGPWCSFLQRISQLLNPTIVLPVSSLLSTMCEHLNDYNAQERNELGEAARNVLAFSRSLSPRNSWLVGNALTSVCQTYESDADASATILGPSLEPGYLAEFGYQELPWIAREVRRLIPIDPEFVEYLYKAVFAREEASEEQTSLSDSRLLGLLSTKRQDYGNGLWSLGEAFPYFLSEAAIRATSALISALSWYVNQRHRPSSGKVVEDSFLFGDVVARLRTDYSAVWDKTDLYGHDDPVKMLNQFMRHLADLAGDPECLESLRELLRIIIRENSVAVLWRRLLALAAKFPDTLGREIWPLLLAVPVLTAYDTTTDAGELLKVIFPSLTETDRNQIERQILSIGSILGDEQEQFRTLVQDRLIGCLDKRFVTTDEVRQRIEEFEIRGSIPANEPPFKWEGVTGSSFEEIDFLAQQGVPIKDELVQRLQVLEKPLKTFKEKHLNSTPSPEEVAEILPHVQTLWSLVRSAGVHPKQEEYVLDLLAETCQQIAGSGAFSCSNASGHIVREILFEAAKHSNPAGDPRLFADFDQAPSWSSPSPRIVGAAGLTKIARHPSCVSPEVLDMVEVLARDPVPAVRLQIASHLRSLYRGAPGRMWKIIARMSGEEVSGSVVNCLISATLWPLAVNHTDDIAKYVNTIFDRFDTHTAAATLVRSSCVNVFLGLYVWHGHSFSKDIVTLIAQDPVAFPDEAASVSTFFRDQLTVGPIDPIDPKLEAARQRSFEIVEILLGSAWKALQTILVSSTSADSPEGSDRNATTAQGLAKIIDQIGMQIYFASGAFAEAQPSGSPHRSKVLSMEQKKRFYSDAVRIFDLLATVGVPSVAHHLLETLEAFLDFDARATFLRISAALRASSQYGYQHESQAAHLFVRLVERFLADHREIFQDDADCRKALRDALDLFVGWPIALRLVYRLEEIFR
jgi:hypothetical protein